MSDATPSSLLLHVGCGDQRLEGWVNIDRQELPTVDVVADVSLGLPFDDAGALFAEHFLEHLPLDQALAFLLEAYRVLAPGGRLRLSTPNLDWVLATQYRPGAPADEARGGALRLNRSFYGWSHRFLWNRPLLGEALAAVGFTEVHWCRHGESGWAPFRGLERHVTYDDSPEVPHVLVVEARKGAPQPARLAALRELLRGEFLADVRPVGWAVDPARSSVIARLRVGGPLRFLVRQHVFRAAWVGGAVHVLPEAPEESSAVVDIDVRHLLADEATLRAIGRQPGMPEWLRRRSAAKLCGPGYLDADRWPLIRFRAGSFPPPRGGRVALDGELELRGGVVPLAVEAQTAREGDSWRARGHLSLSPAALGLPPWRLARGMVRDVGELLVDFDVVATPVSPT